MPCGCAKRLDARPAPPPSTMEIVPHDGEIPNCGKACTFLSEGNVMRVRRSWWNKLGAAQRAFAVAHELAHNEGHDCEACADERAGQLMRAWGYTKRATLMASRIVHSRPAHIDAARGYGD